MIDAETPKGDSQPDLDEIYARMRRRVFRMFGYRDDIEDIVQAAMEAFVKAKSTFRGEGSIEGFAEAITANVARTWMYKHRRVAAVHAMVAEHEPWPKLEPAPSEEAERKDKLRRLLAIIERLKPKYRMAVLLYYVEGKSVAEIAKSEGCTENAAYVRISRGRKEIRRRAKRDPVLAEMLEELDR
jgi:RNA polymerase sigma-70 factor (ECF subfamily)